jgi:hypothetical protein
MTFRQVFAILFALAAAVIAGCTGLLPRGQIATQETWPDYDAAKAAIEAIVPYESRREDLVAAGVDPEKNPSITILNYSDIVQRFAVSGAVKAEELDRGVRECLRAGKACTGFAILVRSMSRKRIGGFWMDVLNFRRDVDVTGWSFNSLILMIDDLVVYTLYGGQPKIHEQEVSRNPLGPVQESLPSMLLK